MNVDAEITLAAGIVCALVSVIYYQLAARVNEAEEKFVSKELFREAIGSQNRQLDRIEIALANKASRDDLPAQRGRLPSSTGEHR